MGKMQNALIVTAIIDVAMALFYHTTPNSSLLDWVLHPFNFLNGSFFSIFNVNLFTAIAAVGIIAGLYFVRSDFVVYAALGAILVTFGATIYQFWQWIDTAMQFAGNDIHGYMASAICLPLFIFYMFSISDYIRGRD